MAEYDDGAYYEVQLNNKQLVFFFMATLAIAVVVFLCGVMVGRGVRDATLQAGSNDIAAGRLSPLGQDAKPKPADKPQLDYTERLETDRPKESLKSVSPETIQSEPKRSPAPAAKPPAKPPAKPAAKPAAKPPPKPQTAMKSTPRATGNLGSPEGSFTIQVVALKTEDGARSLLTRLQQKNYRAYLEGDGGAGLHRVRVGHFRTRAEAERVAKKLRDEEKFRPYITQ